MISRAVSSICVFDYVQFSTYSCLLFYENGKNKKLEINFTWRSNEGFESFLSGFTDHQYKTLQFYLKITTKKTFNLNKAVFKQLLMKNRVKNLEIKFDIFGEDADGTLPFGRLVYATDFSLAKKLILNFSHSPMTPQGHWFLFECM